MQIEAIDVDVDIDEVDVAEPPSQALTTTNGVIVGVAMMDASEARQVVETIKGHLDHARRLLLDLEEREGWRALGYKSWRECAAAEFGGSVATLYRQLEAAKIERDVLADSQLEKNAPIPTAQLQAVKQLAPAQRPEAFKRADQIAGDQPRTAAHVAQAVAEIALPDLSDILLRLDAHGYAKTTTRQQGITTFYSFRDYSGRSDETGGELEMAEGQLPLWLAELDSSAAYAQAKQERYLDMQRRFAVLRYDLRRDGAQFKLIKPEGGMLASGPLDMHMKTLAKLEASAPPPLPDPDTQHMETIKAILMEAESKGERTGTHLYQQAYDHAREIHDVALYNKAIALIDQATDTPPLAPAGPTLADLDATLPKALSDAGYYWQSATPPIIAHNDGWTGQAPTYEQALVGGRERERRRHAPMIDLPPFPASDLPALMESISFLLEMTGDWVPSSREKSAPALGLLRAIGRKALELSERKY